MLKWWAYKIDWELVTKMIWGRSISKILQLINDQPVCLDGFFPVEIMLRYVPKWKIIYEKTQDIMLGITHRAIQEAE